jgi:hypothetical protein
MTVRPTTTATTARTDRRPATGAADKGVEPDRPPTTHAAARGVGPNRRPSSARDCTSTPRTGQTTVSSRRPGDRLLARESGQASVELVAVIPLVVTVGFVVFSFMAAAAAEELAAQAAKAGAVALLQDRDPTEAARAALPGGSRRSARVAVDGRRVTVRVRPRGPIGPINDRLTARAAADAGPEPTG